MPGIRSSLVCMMLENDRSRKAVPERRPIVDFKVMVERRMAELKLFASVAFQIGKMRNGNCICSFWFSRTFVINTNVPHGRLFGNRICREPPMRGRRAFKRARSSPPSGKCQNSQSRPQLFTSQIWVAFRDEKRNNSNSRNCLPALTHQACWQRRNSGCEYE